MSARDRIMARIAAMTNDERRQLHELSRHPDQWPERHRPAVPAIQLELERFEAMTADEIARRIGQEK